MATRQRVGVSITEPAMAAAQRAFLLKIFGYSAIAAALQRAGVYRHGATDVERERMRRTLNEQLGALSSQYETEVPEERHIQNLLALSMHMSSSCGSILREGRFRLGCAQKALNLYLKFLWCAGLVPTPPHCPIDRVILSRVGRSEKWTRIDKESEYRTIINALKEHAKGCSLAEWELEEYEKPTLAQTHSSLASPQTI